MATIYRFIVESQSNGGNNYVVDENGEVQPLAGAGSKMGGGGGSGGNRSLVAHNPSGRNFGGVEHNRYMRPINPLLNRWTGGYWEKGQRAGRAVGQISNQLNAGMGLKALTGTAGLILLQLAIMEFDKWFREQQRKAKEENKSNYLKIISGQTVLGQDYKVSRNIFGKITYRNQ
jgi:hypothetical protein